MGGSADVISGLAGNDLIEGRSGSDVLGGGAGSDRLAGGLEGDRFLFGAVDYSEAKLGSIDHIIDYSFGGGDSIDLTTIVGTAYAAGAGQPASSLVRVVQDLGGTFSLLQVDPNGAAGGAQWLTLTQLDDIRAGQLVNVILDSNAASPDASISVQGLTTAWSITPASQTFNETAGTVTFTVTRPDDAKGQTVYVSTTVNQGSANGGDYDALIDLPVPFLPGDKTATFSVNIKDNLTPEGYESFGLIVQTTPDPVVSRNVANTTFTIRDNDVQANVTPGSGNDLVTITPQVPGTQSFDGRGGTDTAIVNFSLFDTGVRAFYNSNTSDYTISTPKNQTPPSHEVRLNGVENVAVLGGSGDDELYVDSGNNTLVGGGGNDIIAGGSGRDVLSGDAGNDQLSAAGTQLDVIDGGSGIDRLDLMQPGLTQAVTVVNGTGRLANGTVLFTGIELLGLVTGSGNDRVEFGFPAAPGGQRFYGGEGIDTAIVNFSLFDTGVRAFYNSNTSDYTISTPKNQTPPSHEVRLNGVENVAVLGGSGDDELYVDSGNNTLVGGGGNDIIAGGSGRDVLSGDAGNDSVYGGAGQDKIDGGSGSDSLDGGDDVDLITGGAGADILTGGAARDIFNYTLLSDSRNDMDTITDFLTRLDDIKLAAIDANTLVEGDQAFAFIGDQAFHGVAGELRFQQIASLNSTVISGDVNGDGTADLRIKLIGLSALAAGDFIL